MLLRHNPSLYILKVYPVAANGHSHSDRCDNIQCVPYLDAIGP